MIFSDEKIIQRSRDYSELNVIEKIFKICVNGNSKIPFSKS